MNITSFLFNERPTGFPISGVSPETSGWKNLSQSFPGIQANSSSEVNHRSHNDNLSHHSVLGGGQLLLFITAAVIPLLVQKFLYFVNVVWPNILFWCITRSFFCRESLVVEEPICSHNSLDKKRGRTILSNGILIEAIILYSAYCLKERARKEEEFGVWSSQNSSLGFDKGKSSEKHGEETFWMKWFRFCVVKTSGVLLSSVLCKKPILQGQFVYTSREGKENSSFFHTSTVTSPRRRGELAKVLSEDYELHFIPPEHHSIEVEPGLWILFEGSSFVSEEKHLHGGTGPRNGKKKGLATGKGSGRRKRKGKHARRGYPEEMDETCASFWLSDFLCERGGTQEQRNSDCLSMKKRYWNGSWKKMRNLHHARGPFLPFTWKSLGPFPLKNRKRKHQRGADVPPKWWLKRKWNEGILGRTGSSSLFFTNNKVKERDTSSSSSSSDFSDSKNSRGSSRHSSENGSRKQRSENGEEPFVPLRRVWLYCCDPFYRMTTFSTQHFLYSEWEAKERQAYDERHQWWRSWKEREKKAKRKKGGGGEPKYSAMDAGMSPEVEDIETAIMPEGEENGDLKRRKGASLYFWNEGAKETEEVQKRPNIGQWLTRNHPSMNRANSSRNRASNRTTASWKSIFPFRENTYPFSTTTRKQRCSEISTKVGRLDYFIHRAYLWYQFHQVPSSMDREVVDAEESSLAFLVNTKTEKGEEAYSDKENLPSGSEGKRVKSPNISHRNAGLFHLTSCKKEKKRFFIYPSKSECQELLEETLKLSESRLKESTNHHGNRGYSVSDEDSNWNCCETSSFMENDNCGGGPIHSVKRYAILNAPTFALPSPTSHSSSHDNSSSTSSCRMKRKEKDSSEDVWEDGTRGEEANYERTENAFMDAHRDFLLDTPFFHTSEPRAVGRQVGYTDDKQFKQAEAPFFTCPLLSAPHVRACSPIRMEGKEAARRLGKQMKTTSIEKNQNNDNSSKNKVGKKEKDLFDGIFFPQRDALRKLLMDFKDGTGVYAKPGFPHRLHLLISAGNEGMRKSEGICPPCSSISAGTNTSCALNTSGPCEDIPSSEPRTRKAAENLGKVNSLLAVGENNHDTAEVEMATMDIVKAVAFYLQRSIVVISLKTILTNTYLNSWLHPLRIRCEGEEVYPLPDLSQCSSDTSSLGETSVRAAKLVTSLRPTEVVYWIRDIEEIENFGQEALHWSEHVPEKNIVKGASTGIGLETKESAEVWEKEKADAQTEEDESSNGALNQSPENRRDKSLHDALAQAACAILNDKDRLSVDGVMRALVPSMVTVSGRVVILSSNKQIGDSRAFLNPRWIRTPLLLNLHITVLGCLRAHEALEMIHSYHFNPSPKEQETIKSLFPSSECQKKKKAFEVFQRKMSKEGEATRKMLVPPSVLRDCCFHCDSVKDILLILSHGKLQEYF